ncbi:hypothetical protein LX36DRAFT_14726 [Colletotrichum falcatum]|nr:hypothetical protein LX36DRAFT_14726 [Colletotrichum falcatum]
MPFLWTISPSLIPEPQPGGSLMPHSTASSHQTRFPPLGTPSRQQSPTHTLCRYLPSPPDRGPMTRQSKTGTQLACTQYIRAKPKPPLHCRLPQNLATPGGYSYLAPPPAAAATCPLALARPKVDRFQMRRSRKNLGRGSTWQAFGETSESKIPRNLILLFYSAIGRDSRGA